MDKPIMTKSAIKYTIKQLFKIANPKQNLKYDIYIKSKEKKVTISFKEGVDNKTFTFNLVDDKDWYNLLEGKPNILNWVYNAKCTYKIPILFWKDNQLQFANFANDGEVIFNADIISSSFFMLSRWEEKYSTDLDIHSRFKYENSVAFKYKFINIPVVDEYAMILRKYLQMLFPNINLGNNKFRVKLSHDIDNIRRFEDLNQTIRTLMGDLLKSKSISLFKKSLLEYKHSFNNPEKDPYFLAVYKLAQLSKDNAMDSAFYFKTANKSKYDSGYTIDEYVKKCIFNLKEKGFEVGFHPGYSTFQNYDKLIQEKEILDNILGYTKYGGRQHYLRFDVNTTWNYWEKAGLEYDSTLGYAEQEGFRCGTCHAFRPFDINGDRELNIIEIPLIAMEGTLQSYRKLTTEEGLRSILDLADKCKEVEGVFTLLWHNTSLYRGWEHWVEDVYKTFLRYKPYW